MSYNSRGKKKERKIGPKRIEWNVSGRQWNLESNGEMEQGD